MVGVIQESKISSNSQTPYMSINFSRKPESPETLIEPHFEELTIATTLGNTELMSTISLDRFLCGGGSPIIPIFVHQSVCPSIWPAVPSLQQGLSRGDNVMRAVEEVVCGGYRGAKW